jgi:hypothetical protein
VHLHAAIEQVVSRLRDAHVRLDPAHERLIAPAEVEAVRRRRREADLGDRLDPVEVLGHLRDRRSQPLRVLLGGHHRQPQDVRPAHQRGDFRRNRVEVEHGRPERLLDVHDHQSGAAAVEHPGWRH